MSRSALGRLALGTLGVLTSQIILIRNRRAVMVAEHERLALQMLHLVSPGRTPSPGVVAAWIEGAAAGFFDSGAIRLDVGFSFESGPSDPAPTVVAALTPAPEPTMQDEPCRLVLAGHPSVTFAPSAGLPLVVSAERAVLGRSARVRGATDVVLQDLAGFAVDLAANTLVVQLPDGLCTPAVTLGAVRTPLLDRLVSTGVLTEVSIDAGSLQGFANLMMTRWGSVVPVVSLEDRALPAGGAAADRLGKAVQAALLT